MLGAARAPELHVMTYNIRRRMLHLNPRSPDRWGARKHLLRRILSVERPTILGIQEGLLDQVLFVAEVLGPHYRWIGYGRNADRRGERCVIYYDSTRLQLERWEQFALSDTPGVSGSTSWGNRIPRTAVSAHFTDLATSLPLHVVNTHFDHISAQSRVHSARLVAAVVRASGGPTIVMGDANSGTDSRAYGELLTGSGLADSWLVAERRLTPLWGTYSAYRAPQRHHKRIDWLFVSPDIRVEATGINAVRYGGAAPSDHEPVQARVVVSATGGPPRL
jgi:endonuclease/exonuclease/phosphatase family metal-dependent hydrolase